MTLFLDSFLAWLSHTGSLAGIAALAIYLGVLMVKAMLAQLSQDRSLGVIKDCSLRQVALGEDHRVAIERVRADGADRGVTLTRIEAKVDELKLLIHNLKGI